MESINNKTKDFEYYVYEHYLDGELIYIGKGTKERALDLAGRNCLWKAKVNGRESDVEVKIIATFKDSDNAELFEQSYIRLISETNDQLTNILHNKHNAPLNFQPYTSTLEKVRLKKLFINNNYHQKHTKAINHLNQLEDIVDDFNKYLPDCKYKGVLYAETIQSMNNAKEILINKGYNPLVIWSTTNIYNNNMYMDMEHIAAKNELINTGKIPEPYDFLIFNSHLFTRVHLKDDYIKVIVINSTNIEVQQYVRGLVGKDVDLLVCKTNNIKNISKLDIIVPDEYINKPLNVKLKQDLCNELNIIGVKGLPIKWTTMKRELKIMGYHIKDTQMTIDSTRYRVSIINKENSNMGNNEISNVNKLNKLLELVIENERDRFFMTRNEFLTDTKENQRIYINSIKDKMVVIENIKAELTEILE